MTKRKIFELTNTGKEKLEQEREERNTSKRKQLAEVVEDMRNRGDLSENDGYMLALQDYQSNEARIAEINDILENHIIIEAKDDGKVGVGEKVTVKTATNQTITYEIVGQTEASPLERKITADSPIGKALVGKKVGAKVTISLPAGDQVYEVISIG